jgi:hypothetical protein
MAWVTDANTCKALYRAVQKSLQKVWELPTDADKAAMLRSRCIRYVRMATSTASFSRMGTLAAR